MISSLRLFCGCKGMNRRRLLLFKTIQKHSILYNSCDIFTIRRDNLFIDGKAYKAPRIDIILKDQKD